MSEENVEIVRLAYAAFSEGDLDALAQLTDPDWVFDFSRSIGPDYMVGPGGEIVVRHHVSAKGRGSGVEWERIPDAMLVWELRDRKIIKTTLYQRRAEALEAAGLSERTAQGAENPEPHA